MKLATNNQCEPLSKLSVLLDFGRYSNCFDYLDEKKLGVEIGDIVLVTFKGHLCSGVVLEKMIISKNSLNNSPINNKSIIKYLFIEKILQKEVFISSWKDWLEELAKIYKVSSSKMIKTAFPNGWIGKYKKNANYLKSQIWISISKKNHLLKNKLTPKQSSLVDYLIKNEGIWQSELIKFGFTTNLINRLSEKGFISKTKRNISEKDYSHCDKNNPVQNRRPWVEIKIPF